MKTLHIAVLNALIAAGITTTSSEPDIKKAYFTVAGAPLTKANLPVVVGAIAGDEALIDRSEPTASTPVAAKTKTKTPAAPKEPRVVKPAETATDALARLKADPKTSARWARVQSVDEMGKRGPTVVTIVCDDKGPEDQQLTRQIKVQDLFQVRFSKGYAKKQARRKTPAATETAVTPAS